MFGQLVQIGLEWFIKQAVQVAKCVDQWFNQSYLLGARDQQVPFGFCANQFVNQVPYIQQITQSVVEFTIVEQMDCAVENHVLI